MLYCVRQVGVVCTSTRRLVRCEASQWKGPALIAVPLPLPPGASRALQLDRTVRLEVTDLHTARPERCSLKLFRDRVPMGAGWYSPSPPIGSQLMSKMETRRQGGRPPADRATNLRNESSRRDPLSPDRLPAYDLNFESFVLVAI